MTVFCPEYIERGTITAGEKRTKTPLVIVIYIMTDRFSLQNKNIKN